jgi:hypothetical protein
MRLVVDRQAAIAVSFWPFMDASPWPNASPWNPHRLFTSHLGGLTFSRSFPSRVYIKICDSCNVFNACHPSLDTALNAA